MRERAFRLSEKKTRFIRAEFGRSAEIARTIGISEARLSHYLKGVRHTPETILMQLCEAVNRKPGDFLADAAEKILLQKEITLDIP